MSEQITHVYLVVGRKSASGRWGIAENIVGPGVFFELGGPDGALKGAEVARALGPEVEVKVLRLVTVDVALPARGRE